MFAIRRIILTGLCSLALVLTIGFGVSAASNGKASTGERRSGMRAIVVEEFGGPEVLKLGEAPEPEVKNGLIPVEVSAAGIALRFDLYSAYQSSRNVLPGASKTTAK